MTEELEQRAKKALGPNQWYETCPASTMSVDPITKKKLTRDQLVKRAAETEKQLPEAVIEVVKIDGVDTLRIRSKSPKFLAGCKIVTVD